MADWVSAAAFLSIVIYTHGVVSTYSYLRRNSKDKSIKAALKDLPAAFGWVMFALEVMYESTDNRDSLDESIEEIRAATERLNRLADSVPTIIEDFNSRITRLEKEVTMLRKEVDEIRRRL